MLISDWSSDVCSSDLIGAVAAVVAADVVRQLLRLHRAVPQRMEQRVFGIHRGQPREKVGVGLRQSAWRIGAALHGAAQRERNGGGKGDRTAFGGGGAGEQIGREAVWEREAQYAKGPGGAYDYQKK